MLLLLPVQVTPVLARLRLMVLTGQTTLMDRLGRCQFRTTPIMFLAQMILLLSAGSCLMTYLQTQGAWFRWDMDPTVMAQSQALGHCIILEVRVQAN